LSDEVLEGTVGDTVMCCVLPCMVMVWLI